MTCLRDSLVLAMLLYNIHVIVHDDVREKNLTINEIFSKIPSRLVIIDTIDFPVTGMHFLSSPTIIFGSEKNPKKKS